MSSEWEFYDPVKKGRRGVEFYMKIEGSKASIFFTQTSGNDFDWKANLTLWKTPLFENDPECKCHKGFLDLAYISLEIIEHVLKDNDRHIKQFRIGGVSQGGAVALLVALLLKQKNAASYFDVDSYGAPACVNRKLRDKIYNLDARFIVWDIHHKLDIVVHLIPYWLFGFFYAGNKVSLSKKKWYNFFKVIHNHRYIVKIGYGMFGIKE